MGLLDGDLQQMFGDAFGDLLLEGRHYVRGEPGRDGKGNVTPGVTRVQSVKGYRQNMSTRMREDLGYTDDSAVLLILQTYQGRVIERPARGQRIVLDGDWIAGNVDEDPAHTHYIIPVSRNG